MRKPMFQLFANYNQNLNQAMIQAMKQLDTDSLLKNQHAFFGSILGTMNHLMVGDLIWLNRFNQFFNFKSFSAHDRNTKLNLANAYQIKNEAID